MNDWPRDVGIVSEEGKALPEVLNSLLEQARCHTKLASCLHVPPVECHEDEAVVGSYSQMQSLVGTQTKTKPRPQRQVWMRIWCLL